MARYFVGLDVHVTHTSVCILDRNGKRVKRQKVCGPWTKVADLEWEPPKTTAWRSAKSGDAEWMLGDPVVYPLSNLTKGASSWRPKIVFKQVESWLKKAGRNFAIRVIG